MAEFFQLTTLDRLEALAFAANARWLPDETPSLVPQSVWWECQGRPLHYSKVSDLEAVLQLGPVFV
jgi:hypothetical protein